MLSHTLWVQSQFSFIRFDGYGYSRHSTRDGGVQPATEEMKMKYHSNNGGKKYSSRMTLWFIIVNRVHILLFANAQRRMREAKLLVSRFALCRQVGFFTLQLLKRLWIQFKDLISRLCALAHIICVRIYRARIVWNRKQLDIYNEIEREKRSSSIVRV